MKCTSLQSLVVMLVMAAAAPVAAEEPSSPQSSPFSTQALQHVVRDASAGSSSVRLSRYATAQASGRRDSVLNGGLIGAAIGAVAGPYLLVRATHGTDDYRGVMLRLAPFTAFAGFGIGIAIDGMM